jgi:transposase InsO family protein
VVVDKLSKYAHFMSLSHPFTAKAVADKFVEGVVILHGMPKSIISDRDPIFISKFWQEFFTMSGTKLKMSSAYHPQSDGQSEVVNRCLEQYLRSFVQQWPRKWHSFLPWAEFWYNSTFHASTGM